jgi:hypothetical protein
MSAHLVGLAQQEVLAWLIALQWHRHRMLLDLLREKVLREHPMDPGAPEYQFATNSLAYTLLLSM